ncbi:hypothetical protein NEFER03_0404 [Nematocida sp. LUAm3]|nr:hypothetical protein NEFER03_0404 [Nematocida sp. LUAm3]KAI5175980.1 hypothetical protein NEFER02_1826 [Nematocida sp. LUAm2]KAI5179076.1 hypothetical protein NEFER01_1943 [Nematocida sp. LUAm1]
MLLSSSLLSRSREIEDMEDLEVLGSISFDLHLTKSQVIKDSFVSLVSKLGTKEFLQEYALLYKELLFHSEEKRKNEVISFEEIDLSCFPDSEPHVSLDIPTESILFKEITITSEKF